MAELRVGMFPMIGDVTQKSGAASRRSREDEDDAGGELSLYLEAHGWENEMDAIRQATVHTQSASHHHERAPLTH